MSCAGRKFKIKGIAAKIGVTYGTDVIPTAATNAIAAENATMSPLEADVVEQNIDRPGGGNNPTELVGKHIMIEFDVAVSGAGAAGDVPGYGPLIRACGYSETINASTDVRYARVTSGEEWVDIYFWWDGALHKALGARGSFSVEFNKKQLPYFKFKFTALYDGPSTDTNPTLDLSGFVRPKAVSNAMTSFSFHSITPAVESFVFNAGQVVEHDDKPGCESVEITDQLPGFNIAIDAPALASFDPFQLAEDGDLDTTSVTHGTTAGNIVQVTGDYSEISTVNYADHSNRLGYTHEGRYLPDPAGANPDVEVIVK